EVATLNGKMSAKLGKGAIAHMGGGRAGQLLRLVSFDALLRKLQLDFRDRFSNDFNFDSIKGNAVINQGILTSKDLYIDGLVADIALNGDIDLVKRQINAEAVITPEISATVGVATAFLINPFAGAAVFAASKVLGPLWSKISVIRYRVSGSLDEPKIDEVLRQLKETQE
ncbi:AsmA-like C-terminal region-containing protein, partial [Providencia rettgeri]|uniref:YhdP family protein n=1 Tax=Providencia rettgeri TaxID=587 RepID=UPI0032DA1F79